MKTEKLIEQLDLYSNAVVVTLPLESVPHS
jgi:hypothetical protein